MRLFSKTETSYVGVDIGRNNIKIVELENYKGRPKLVTYGFTDIIDKGGEELIDRAEVVASALAEVIRRAKVRSRQVVAALPVSAIFTSIISLTDLKPGDSRALEEAIRAKAKKVIPLPLEEMILYHNRLETTSEPLDGQTTVSRFLLTAAPKQLVKKYLELFNQVNLSIVSLETESFALSRCLVGNDQSAVMLVDLGESTTNISVIKHSVPILNRSIDLAGRDFTAAFAAGLQLDVTAAERFKRDLSQLGSEGAVTTLAEPLSNLVHEINYCFGLYNQEKHPEAEAIEKVILTGGSAALPGLDQYLTSQLKIRVFLGDPWARVMYPEELKSSLDQIGPRMSIAVGLAMREIVS
ncbi:type IV pilus assembly protein PilM [Candidatus Falkowbacteria bacterium]|nr:type IV pilus assembly protein PilM [Candidatus Falkowbacteria bacterium]